MQLETFTAHVVVDGKSLEEYDVVFESPSKATCWIPSEEGKVRLSFSVVWKCHEKFRPAGSVGDMWVDGVGCGRGVIYPGALGQKDNVAHSVLVQLDDSTRDLMFTRIQLTDDDSLLSKNISKDFGQIRLEIHRGLVVQERRVSDNTKPAEPDDNKFHEQCKKASVHCVGFGPAKARKRILHNITVIPNNQPKLTFVFKYQPLDVLQANGIAPRPSPPSDAAGAGDETNNDECDSGAAGEEDIKPFELDGRIRNLENELKRLRDLKADNAEGQPSKRIKREEGNEGPRRRVFIPGEVIDLT